VSRSWTTRRTQTTTFRLQRRNGLPARTTCSRARGTAPRSSGPQGPRRARALRGWGGIQPRRCGHRRPRLKRGRSNMMCEQGALKPRVARQGGSPDHQMVQEANRRLLRPRSNMAAPAGWLLDSSRGRSDNSSTQGGAHPDRGLQVHLRQGLLRESGAYRALQHHGVRLGTTNLTSRCRRCGPRGAERMAIADGPSTRSTKVTVGPQRGSRGYGAPRWPLADRVHPGEGAREAKKKFADLLAADPEAGGVVRGGARAGHDARALSEHPSPFRGQVRPEK